MNRSTPVIAFIGISLRFLRKNKIPGFKTILKVISMLISNVDSGFYLFVPSAYQKPMKYPDADKMRLRNFLNDCMENYMNTQKLIKDENEMSILKSLQTQ